ncbi:MAG TPA: DNA primase small subunit domain-containing protein, partial [Burkholderiaceae bacterium]|nr:DNA primase small subunit domain-containing protein [Burkholderiaceae bacterium]
WNMTTRSTPKPDRMIFDLDPGEGVAWPAVREAAQLMKSFLDELGLKSLLKTSGGKGLHVVVPLAPKHTWQAVRQFSQAIVVHMAQVVPQRFVAKSGPRNRVGKIFIDYLRNGWGATPASAWSARARPGLGVSVPIDWSELAQVDGGAQWNVRNIAPRLAVGNAPWGAFASSRQSLAAAMKALGVATEDVS